MRLSDTAIRKLKPKARDYKTADGGGLYLLVTKAGGKLWKMKYRHASREGKISIGGYPAISLAAARDQANKIRAQLAQGIDPAVHARGEKIERANKSANTLEALAREWHGIRADGWHKDHAARVLRSLVRDVFPVLGHRPLQDITTPEAIAMLRRIEGRGAIEQSHRIAQRCQAIGRYAVQSGKAEHHPFGDLRGALRTRAVTHQPALSQKDLPEFLSRLDSYTGRPDTKLGLTLVLLTWLRNSEVRCGRWDEIDWDARLWTLPASRMKMKRDHVVPLSDQAITALQELHQLTGQSPLMFPGRNDPRKSMSDAAMSNAMKRMGYQGKATVHGFRSTGSTIANEAGFDPDAIERQLAHQEQNRVRAAYHRSQYLDQRRELMQWWADFIDSQRRGANVTPLRRGRDTG